MKLKMDEIFDFLVDNQVDVKVENMNVVQEVDGVSSYFNPEENTMLYFTGNEPTAFDKIKHCMIICKDAHFNCQDSLLIKVEDPQLAFYMICSHFNEVDNHPLGFKHDSVWIRSMAKVNPRTYIGANVVIEDDVVIEEGVKIHSGVHVYSGTTIKANTVIEANSSIGASGVAWIWDKNGKRWDLPQIGGVIIEEDCFIGTDVTIVRGSLNENTLIGRGSKLAHGTKIGHGCQIGEDCHLANNVSLAGSTILGKRCFVGSGVSIRPRTKIADDVTLGTGSAVVKHIEEAGSVWAGVPAKLMKSSNFSGMPTPLHKKQQGNDNVAE